MAERRAEIAELTRRVAIGALLTAPVLSHEFFRADWVPAQLLNHWVQLALITPVMFYTGWPIHRIGWLALAHRSAEMNSLITLGTSAAYCYSLLVTIAPGLLPAEVRDVYFEAVGSKSEQPVQRGSEAMTETTQFAVLFVTCEAYVLAKFVLGLPVKTPTIAQPPDFSRYKKGRPLSPGHD
jgi:hypothetical protein